LNNPISGTDKARHLKLVDRLYMACRLLADNSAPKGSVVWVTSLPFWCACTMHMRDLYMSSVSVRPFVCHTVVY